MKSGESADKIGLEESSKFSPSCHNGEGDSELHDSTVVASVPSSIVSGRCKPAKSASLACRVLILSVLQTICSTGGWGRRRGGWGRSEAKPPAAGGSPNAVKDSGSSLEAALCLSGQECGRWRIVTSNQCGNALEKHQSRQDQQHHSDPCHCWIVRVASRKLALYD